MYDLYMENRGEVGQGVENRGGGLTRLLSSLVGLDILDFFRQGRVILYLFVFSFFE